MKSPAEISTSLSHSAVVGTVHSRESLAAARRLGLADCDWVELRVDAFHPATASLLAQSSKLKLPRIVTVRHPSEGGMVPTISDRERRQLYRDFLPVAGLVDIELRSAGRLAEVIREAKAAGIGVILSHHDFVRTPTLKKLRDLARRAAAGGADIFKVAAMTRTPVELAMLIDFIGNEKNRLRMAVMGMGRYGKVSRLALAQAGSCLNYGYLGSPNASGQWPVKLLKARIAELRQTEDQEAGAA